MLNYSAEYCLFCNEGDMKICVSGRTRASPVVAGARKYSLLHIPFMVRNIQNFFLLRAAPAPDFTALAA